MYLELLVTAVLAAHLLAMNVASAGPLVAAALWPRDCAAADAKGALSTQLTSASLAALIVGIILGGALLVVPSPGVRAALARFPASLYWFAGTELLFSAICMSLLLALQRRKVVGPRGAWALAFMTSLNLLYHFPPLMAVFGELAANPAWAPAGQIDHAAMLRLWARPEILALWAHFTLAAIATAAVYALWILHRRPAPPLTASQNDAGPDRRSRRLATAALAATLLQIPVGVWLVVVSADSVRSSILGGSLAPSFLFLSGMVATFVLLQSLVQLACGDQTLAATRRAAWLLVAIVVLMTGTLRTSRLRADHRTAGGAAVRGGGAGQGGRYFSSAAASACFAFSLSASSTCFSSSVKSFFAASKSPPGSSPLAIISP